MYLVKQSSTQVYSPFGSYVVEQYDSAFFDYERHFNVPEQEVSPARTENAKFEVGDLLSMAQAAVGQSLQHYYQFHAAGPTPTRLQMLLNELNQRAEADSLKDIRKAV